MRFYGIDKLERKLYAIQVVEREVTAEAISNTFFEFWKQNQEQRWDEGFIGHRQMEHLLNKSYRSWHQQTGGQAAFSNYRQVDDGCDDWVEDIEAFFQKGDNLINQETGGG